MGLLAGISTSRADPGNEANAKRIASLIRQLGHKDFAKRQAASKELDAIGAPALDGLRKAATDDDPEVRRRAERIIQDVSTRLKELQAAQVQLDSAAFDTDLPLAESKAAVRRVSLKCRLADGGTGSLSLDPNSAQFNEFGDAVARDRRLPLVTLDCTLKLVKLEPARRLYEVRGPKLVSRLSLVVYKDLTPWGDGRLLIHGKGGDVKYVINLERPQVRTKPCHPGCFPAGTRVRVPGGSKLIERVREGDPVTTIDAAGKPSPVKVTAVFVTRNRLLKVHTRAGTFVTTETQPVALVSGGFRPAGELKAGDRIWRWTGVERRSVTVSGVSPAGRETEVFNLVLGEPRTFIAGDFLVRSKPPAAEPRPGVAAAEVVVPQSKDRR
jgi:hypothetical protein